MTPELHREAGDLFERLRHLPEEERAAALDQACAGRSELSDYVLELLGADRAAAGESFLAQPADAAVSWAAPPQSANLPSPGAEIGNYRLGARIGAGGMGVVFRGEDLRLGRPVAIKFLSFTAGETGPEAVHRFAREARAASRLNHPNIVSIYDADFDPNCHCIATEFIEGQTLRQMLDALPGGLETPAILDIVAQTASALSAAHQAGIVHRDIKPENIMVRPDGFVKVLDFGLAKLYDPAGTAGSAAGLRTHPGIIAGTVNYLSPEQVVGTPADPRSDLFSLGVVAYELATGRRPFEGPTIGAVFNAILHHAPPAPSALRPSLGTEIDSLILRLLEKAPESRIQTAGELRKTALLGGVVPAPRRQKRRWPLAVAASVVLGALALWLTKPPAPLRVGEIVQVTTDGSPKNHFVTDGTRLFYSAGGEDSHFRVFQVSVNGGDPFAISQLDGMFPVDVSPDRSRLMLAQYAGSPPSGPYPIWSADTLGNALRRLGDVTAYEARWSPKGDQIVYGNGAELRIAHSDGSGAHALATFPGIVHDPSWSADGRRIRFVLLSGNNTPLWEVRADGSGAHALLPSWSGYSQRNGAWTPDGREFVFAAGAGRVRDLWSLPNPPFPSWGSEPPQRLTAGPMRASHPEISPDSRRIFFLADFDRGELVRYDAHSETWIPQLGGLSATQVDYSRDGKWMVWVSCPEGSVWRGAVDGGSRLQLTEPPLRAINPRWSPDGSLIAFYGAEPGKATRLYLAPFGGGPVREVSHGEAGSGGDADGSWSPDGASLVFASNSDDQVRQHLPLRVLDLRSGRVAALPGSEGLWSPRWSPDGRSIAALGTPIHELWLFDRETHARRRLAAIGAGFPTWSPDGRFVYFEDNAMTQWYRVAAGSGRIERLASLRTLKMAGSSLGWIGLTPEGSLLATRAAGSTEIYRLEWEPR